MSVPNIFALGQAAYKDAYDTQDTITKDRTKIAAGRQLATGDYTGAASTLNANGQIDDAHNVIADQQVIQDRQQASQGRQADQAAKVRAAQAAGLLKLTEIMETVPEGQRQAWLKTPQTMQTIQSLGLPVQQFAQLDEAHLTNEALKPWKEGLNKEKLHFITQGPDTLAVGEDSGQVKQTYRGPLTLKKDEQIYAPDDPGGGQPPVAPAAPAPSAAPAAAPASMTVSPQDRDQLARMMVTEAGGEGPQGMAAVAHVALNRLKSGYGGAGSLSDVVTAPNQFEGMSRASSVKLADLQKARVIADQVIAGQIPDPTNGANQFLNPVLETKLGRAQPKWADGSGQRIGNHVFYGGGKTPTGDAGTTTLAGSDAGDAPPPAPKGYHLLAAGATEPEEAPLSDSAVKLQAGMYLKTGQMPPLGMGKSAHADRVKIMNEMDNIAKSLGLSADDIVSGTVSMKAASKGLEKATAIRSQVEGSEATVNKNAQLALSLAPKGGGPTGMPVLNRVIQHVRGQYAGDPDVAAYEAAIGTVAEEYSKVMTTNTGTGGATSDTARKTAYERLSTASTLPQLRSVIATLQTEMQNRASSLRDVEEGLRSQVRGANSQAPAPAAATPEPPAPPRQRPPLAAIFK